jgi:hypothetical protein
VSGNLLFLSRPKVKLVKSKFAQNTSTPATGGGQNIDESHPLQINPSPLLEKIPVGEFE